MHLGEIFTVLSHKCWKKEFLSVHKQRTRCQGCNSAVNGQHWIVIIDPELHKGSSPHSWIRLFHLCLIQGFLLYKKEKKTSVLTPLTSDKENMNMLDWEKATCSSGSVPKICMIWSSPCSPSCFQGADSPHTDPRTSSHSATINKAYNKTPICQ